MKQLNSFSGIEKKIPLLSIVTPSYNTGKYIKSTIESIIIQDYPNIEHIIFDGGSTDETIDILKSYPNVSWISEKDRGQSHALNKGFSKAKGEIIGWLNADDTYTPGAINKAVNYLITHQEVDIVCSDLNIIDESDSIIGLTKSGPFNIAGLLSYNMVKQPTVFMRKKVIDRLKGVNEKYHYVMDQEFWLRVGISGFNVEYLPGPPLANFRLCKGTKTFEDGPGFASEWLEVLENAFDLPYFENVPSKTKNKAINKIKSDFHLSKMLQALDDGNQSKMFTHFFNAIKNNFSLISNLGAWKFLAQGLMGIKPDRFGKFQKN